MKNSKIRKSARGQDCQIRLENTCNGNPETTVFCHVNGAGVGKKSLDMFGAYGCSDCHREVDRLPSLNHIVEFEDAIKLLKFYEAVMRTQKLMLEDGLIVIK